MGEYRDRVTTAVDALRATPPQLHGDSEMRNLGIGFEVLDWLADRLKPSDVTLETGCGYSTIVFAAAGTQHSVISPVPQEHERIRTWCKEHGINTGSLEFVLRRSQDVLPRFRPDPLDLVLIDGCHAFPVPFLDWYYTAGRLRQGGLLALDETHLRTGGELREFLAAEAGRWKLVEEFEKTAVFQKLLAEVLDVDWTEQPWAQRRASDKPGWRERLQSVRGWVEGMRRRRAEPAPPPAESKAPAEPKPPAESKPPAEPESTESPAPPADASDETETKV